MTSFERLYRDLGLPAVVRAIPVQPAARPAA
jgi:hypothetical protein